MKRQFILTTPIGLLYITSEDNCITRVAVSCDRKVQLCNVLTDFELSVKKQIEEYFYGKRTIFDFPFLIKEGTLFQQNVWRELCKIPYGVTRSYGEIARCIGKQGASRAVGTACNRNPLLLVVPCHRVIGSDGSLVGFACGLDRKSFLLGIEGRKLSIF